MLVLTRREGERIILSLSGDGGEQIEIAVSIHELRKGSVKVGIDAPKRVKIVREELVDEPAAVAEGVAS